MKIWQSEKCFKYLYCVFIVSLLITYSLSAKGKGKKGKKGGKSSLSFFGVNVHSRAGSAVQQLEPGAPKIVKASHFQFNFRLGYKIWLVCLVTGDPMPIITWYKDGSEIIMKDTIWIEMKTIDPDSIYTKIEIDPAVLGDAGIYECMASNNVTNISRSFKVDLV